MGKVKQEEEEEEGGETELMMITWWWVDLVSLVGLERWHDGSIIYECAWFFAITWNWTRWKSTFHKWKWRVSPAAYLNV